MEIEQIVKRLNYLERKSNWSNSELEEVNRLEQLWASHPLANNYSIDHKTGTFYLKKGGSVND
tara:strand:+ start:1051 stop:1239 length:189 start_codon:yes stop_codon:yes gene_type:complete